MPLGHLHFARTAAAVALGVMAASGCGQARESVTTAHLQATGRIVVPVAHTPVISGGSPAERALLRRIVRGLRPTQLRRLRVEPAPKQWHPLRPGDVELMATEAPVAHSHDNSLGDWEAWLVGGAFRDRSASLGLPRVVVVANGSGADRVTGGRALPAAPPKGLAAFRRRVMAAAEASGGRVVYVRTALPDGYSADVALQVAHPVGFLRRRLRPLQLRLQRLRSDGIFLALYEANGRPLFVSGGSTRLSSGLAGVPDRRYRSCVEVGFGGPFTLAPPLPCPSDWRPPASTPPKRLVLQGWESGGRANGGSSGGGNGVSYLPGTTLGLGFTLENPNGHPVTVLAITPAVSKLAPIRYTGAEIQIPSSRANPGTAAELQEPYSPEPPIRPFTIQPGDWVGVGLHYKIAHACTTATAGRQITENRTLTITYILQGKTIRHAYANLALTITLPATCPH
jgi:hypothetical protein